MYNLFNLLGTKNLLEVQEYWANISKTNSSSTLTLFTIAT